MGEPKQMDVIPYHRSNLYKELSGLGDDLAELRYIDHTIAYLRSLDDPLAWTSPAPAVPYDEHDITVGTTFPFVWRIRIAPPPFGEPPVVQEWGPASPDWGEHIIYHVNGIKVAAAKWGWENMESVTKSIEEITWPNSSMYTHRVTMPLREAHTTLQDDVSADIGQLGHTIDNWNGRAASNFSTNFYSKFGPMRVSQERVFEALVGGLVTAKAIDESSQHSLMTAIHYVREMAGEQLQLRQQQGEAHLERRQFDLSDSARLISIISGGASLVTAVAGRSLWALGMAFVAEGLEAAASSIPETDPFTLEGQNADDLLGTLADAISEIKTNAGEQDRLLSVKLEEEVFKRVEGLLGENGRLYPILPTIAEEDLDRDTFRHETSGR